MIPSYLAKLILENKAEFRQYAIGGSGVGTIPVQQNEKVIITDFTWYPFCEQNLIAEEFELNYFPLVILFFTPPSPPNLHVGDTIQALDALSLPIGTGKITSMGSSPFFIEVEILSGDFSTIDSFQDLFTLNTQTVTSVVSIPFAPVEGLVDTDTLATAQINTDTPSGAAGLSPGVLNLSFVSGTFIPGNLLQGATSSAFVIGGTLIPIPFNIDVAETIRAAIANSIHTLRFTSKNRQSSFNFKDLPSPIYGNIELEGVFFELIGFSLPDPVKVDTFLVFGNSVQIDIFKFSPSGNVFTQGNPPAEASEPNVPNGYRNAVANPPVLNILTGQGATIKPLGTRQEVSGGVRGKDEFVDDIGDLTELNLPFDNNSFPLVNISYVLLHLDKAT